MTLPEDVLLPGAPGSSRTSEYGGGGRAEALHQVASGALLLGPVAAGVQPPPFQGDAEAAAAEAVALLLPPQEQRVTPQRPQQSQQQSRQQSMHMSPCPDPYQSQQRPQQSQQQSRQQSMHLPPYPDTYLSQQRPQQSQQQSRQQSMHLPPYCPDPYQSQQLPQYLDRYFDTPPPTPRHTIPDAEPAAAAVDALFATLEHRAEFELRVEELEQERDRLRAQVWGRSKSVTG